MKVIQTIQTKHFPALNDSVEVQYYNGNDHAQALSALVMAAAERDNSHYTILNVRIEF